MKRIELLAPAGNMDAFKAAVSAGADAVYLGITTFSARAFAGNFSHEELTEALRYAHNRDVKIYVTMNTLLFEEEIDNAMKEADFLYHVGVDALLVQDLGLFHRLKTEYPDFEVHCSTQMHVHNAAGCLFMKSQGASRVVLARETPIEVIRECVKTGIEIEVFAYGALCISYSGQCLLSSSVKNRSGNRGMCAQLCRLRYYPYVHSEKQINPDGDFLLSPKDLNLIDEIPTLIEAGVSSLKIEGRMKRPEYVYYVTSIFRKAIDSYYAGVPYTVSKEEQENLLLLFNRGFTKGHCFHASIDERMSHYRPNHIGIEIGNVLSFNPKTSMVRVKLSRDLHQHDGLRILNTPIDTGLTAVRIYKNGLLVNSAKPNDIVELECKSKPAPKKGQPLQKTSDALLLEEIDRMMFTDSRSIPITMHYRFSVNMPLEITLSDGLHTVTATSLCNVEAPLKAPLSKERLEEALKKMHQYPFVLNVISDTYEAGFLPISFLNETRRRAVEELVKARTTPKKRVSKQPYFLNLDPIVPYTTSVLTIQGTSVSSLETPDLHYEICPAIEENLNNEKDYNHAVISEVGNLFGRHDCCIAGWSMNVTNSYAAAYLLSIKGIEGILVSSEVSEESFERMQKAFHQRYGFEGNFYAFAYGRRDAMLIKGGFMNDMPKSMMDLEGRIYPLISKGSGIISVKEPDIQKREMPKGTKVWMLLGEEKGE